jgi:uncharacterized protein
MTTLQAALAVMSGLIVGVSLGTVGGGGSILAVPLLLYVVRYGDAHAVIGTTALAVAVIAMMNLAMHWRAGTVRWREALTLALPGVAGAVAGAAAGRQVPAQRLLFLFALMMLGVAWWMFRGCAGGRAQHPAGACRELRCALVIAGAGLVIGLLSGFFGIGGGFLLVPALILAARLQILPAIGTSLVAVAAFGLTTAASYAVGGQMSLPAAALLVAGGLGGGMIGSRLAVRLAQRRALLSRVLASLLVVVAVYMAGVNALAFAKG